ncbi:hypothetical protein HYU17_05355 [Candidatus Woesearchaeota archaeon]|nr:hypothetical protein [Candidatus Woesearchaeota archaeon]
MALKTAHSVAIRVFCGEEENEAEIMDGLKALLPFDLEKEKITIQRQSALGFNDRKIAIFEVVLEKSMHTEALLCSLFSRMPETERQMLLRQLAQRIDDKANFFVRLEKESLAKRNDLLVTDEGNCYHVRIKVAAFPSTKEAAMAVMTKHLQKMLQPQTI